MKKIIDKALFIYNKCRKANSSFPIVFIKYLYYWLVYNKKIMAHQNTLINGVEKIKINGDLNIGVEYVGFSKKSDVTMLNVQGELSFKKGYSIGRGCIFDIGENAVVQFGKGGYITANSRFIIMNKLIIGDDCAISWDCEFLDNDFHQISYENKKIRPKEIVIGNHVWIGAGVKVYQGTTIADGCVIASNAVVRGVFLEKNTIIGGNPARVIKHNVNWS